ncbi:MAG TPA: ABC transporter permease subunit [Gemmataceae bacterium]|nr:ABC transporter permease subunit [Gemmataceae bacterium]
MSAISPALGADAVQSVPSLPRAWWYLVLLSFRRQARARQMVWIALGLLAFIAAMTAVATAADQWHRPRYRAIVAQRQAVVDSLMPGDPGQAIADAYFGAARVAVQTEESAAQAFVRWFVVPIFLTFLLPLWSLSFATEAIGGEREQNSLIWLLARPLPRWAVYLAKFLALLPWCLALNVGGFALLCAAGGRPGWTCLALFWPAVLAASLAFAALFHLIGAVFRRPAIIAIGYSFCLEIILGDMPGYMKRVSIGFYAHCMMLETAAARGVQMDEPAVYMPVDGTTALVVLLLAATALLVLGMVVFSRKQYHEGV